MISATLVGLIVSESVKCIRGRHYTAVGLSEANLSNLEVFKDHDGTLYNFRVLDLNSALSISIMAPKVCLLLDRQRCCVVAATMHTDDVFQLTDQDRGVAGPDAVHTELSVVIVSESKHGLLVADECRVRMPTGDRHNHCIEGQRLRNGQVPLCFAGSVAQLAVRVAAPAIELRKVSL